MRQWRVGSLSLGLTLILIGLAAVFQWAGSAGYGIFAVLRWWPVILILLGSEITIAAIQAGRSEPRVKYDWVGVMAIVIITGLSICLEAVNVTGFLSKVQLAMRSSTYSMEERQVVSIPIGTVARAAVTCESGTVEIRTSTGDDLVILGGGSVPALSKDEAVEWLNSFRATSHTEGDTAYITLQAPPFETWSLRSSPDERWVVIVPERLHIDLSSVSEVDVVARGLSADWLITTRGNVSVTLGAEEDLKVIVRTSSHSNVDGNIAWADRHEDPERVKVEPNPEFEPVEYRGDTWTTRGATLGKGSAILQIRTLQDVVVEAPVVRGD